MKQPHFNFEGEKNGIRCKEHLEKGMIDIKHKKCNFEGCLIRPSFGLEGGYAEFCSQHANRNMIDIVNKKCNWKLCSTHPVFNYIGQSTGKYCKKHAEKGMIDVITKKCEEEGCMTTPSQGYLFSSPTRCAKHKLPNMYNKSMLKPVCEKCIKPAYWCLKGEWYPTSCEEHAKLSTHTNVVEKDCKGCNTPFNLPEDQELCPACSGEEPVIEVGHAKELRIQKVLEANKIVLTSHDKIPEFACSQKRPDFVIDLGYQFIIVEVDENRHKGNPKICEVTRMVQIYQDFGGVPVVFIRYNPDDYVNNLGERQKGTRENPTREKRLINLIKKLSRKDVDLDTLPYLSVYTLYYDGDDSVDRRIILDYETTPREILIKRIYFR